MKVKYRLKFQGKESKAEVVLDRRRDRRGKEVNLRKRVDGAKRR